MENLSIIVPIHNFKNRTENLLSWISSPEISHSQVILVHDTSDNQDASEIVRAIKRRTNILLVERYCNSPGLARNVGLERAERDYVVFWDFDDQPAIVEFKKFYNEFVLSGRTCGVGGFAISVGGRTIKQISYTEDSLSKNNSELMVNPCLPRWIFQRETIGNSRFIDSKLGEDQFFLATLEVFDQNLFLWGSTTYTYFVGDPNQLTRNKSIEKLSLTVALMLLGIFGQVKICTKMFCFVAASRITLSQIVRKKKINREVAILLLKLCRCVIRNPRLFRVIPKIFSSKNSINLRN
jgi:hypothetical protein